MFVAEIVAIMAITAFAVGRQTVLTEVVTRNRFTPAIAYGIVGLVVGGFARPHGAIGYGLLVAGLVLSVVVGVIRGDRTDVWMELDGRIVRQGNAVTVLLFLGAVGAVLALDAISDIAGGSDIAGDAGIGEIIVMIAVMVALQSEIVHRRRQRLALAVQRVPPAVPLVDPVHPAPDPKVTSRKELSP